MKIGLLGVLLATSLGVGVATAQPAPNLPGRGSTYPFVANQIGMPGEVILKCLATPAGRVDQCSVVKETPAGFGFGAAALRNAPNVLIEPAKAGDPPARPVLVPQRFRHALPGHLPPVTSQAALVLARGLPSLLKPIEQSLPTYDLTIDRVISDESGGVPAANRIAAAEALRGALAAKLGEIREAGAVMIASVFTEDELRSIAAFHLTPAGERYAGAGTDQYILGLRLRGSMGDRINLSAGRFYCASHDCRLDLKTPEPTAVSWIQVPDPQAVARARPILSATLGLPSRASLDCALTSDGVLTGCRVVGEAPAGLGVGAAALTLARGFAAGSAEAARRAGQRVTIGVDYPGTPELPPMPEAPPARSARALALAQEIQAKSTTTELQGRSVKEAMSFIPVSWFIGLNDADRQAYLAAAQHGWADVHGQIETRLTQYLANLMSEDDLAAASAFADTAGGVALRDKARSMEDAYRWVSPQLFLIVAAEARGRYCKAMPCDLPAWALPQPRAVSSAPSTRTP